MCFFVFDSEGSVQSNDSVSESSPPAGVPTQVVQQVQTTSQVKKQLKDTFSLCGSQCSTCFIMYALINDAISSVTSRGQCCRRSLRTLRGVQLT